MFIQIVGLMLRLIRLFVRKDLNRVVILPPTNAGSLGDQAMLDGICKTLADEMQKTPVIMAKHGADTATTRPYERIYFNAPGLIGKLRAVLQVVRSGQFIFIGADVIDGRYGGDCKRIIALDIAHRTGLKTAAGGFSFSEEPGATAIQRLKALPDMPMHLRDPVSKERFEKVIGKPGTGVADLAFLLSPEAKSDAARTTLDWMEARKADGHTLLGLNLSGTALAKRKGTVLPVFTEALAQWLRANPARSLVLVPHDYRKFPVGDVELLQEVQDALTPEFEGRLHMLHFPFDAWDVKAVAGQLDFTIVARMHFAIACLGQGTPPLCVAYAGKFEGLMQHFGLTNMTMSEPDLVEAETLVSRITEFETRAGQMRTQINAELPQVKALSKRNFGWL